MKYQKSHEQFSEVQMGSKEEYEAVRAKDLQKYKEQAHRFIDSLEDSFIIFSPKPIDPDEIKDGIPVEIRTLAAICGNTAEYMAVAIAFPMVQKGLIEQLSKQMKEEDVELILKAVEIGKKHA